MFDDAILETGQFDRSVVDFERDITVTFKILVVQAIGQLCFRNDLTRTNHQVFDDTIFETGQFDRSVVDFEFLPGCIERHRAGA